MFDTPLTTRTASEHWECLFPLLSVQCRMSGRTNVPTFIRVGGRTDARAGADGGGGVAYLRRVSRLPPAAWLNLLAATVCRATSPVPC